MKAAATAAICIALALVSFFWFPGHTWLQQDTQIYAPILENQWNSTVLRNDPLAQHPHVAYTLYDEIARAMRAVTRLDFRDVLAIQQIVTRAFGIWGLWLMALAIGCPPGAAWLVAMICSLGALAAGPQVLTFEYEPSPRAFAVPLLICAVGLAAHRRYWGAAVAGAVAFLYHPPTAVPFWALFPLLLLWGRAPDGKASRPSPWTVTPVAVAAAVLFLFSRNQVQTPFFSKLTPMLAELQRMRASYVWISTWPRELVWGYAALLIVIMVAMARARPMRMELRIFAVGLPILGILSMPLSWLLLEREEWALIPQFQPMRALLFIVLMAQFLTAAAGVASVENRRVPEAVLWFTAAYLLPLPWTSRTLLVALLLAGVAILAVKRAPVVGLAAFVAIPLLGGIVNYPRLHTPELAQLSQWARGSTPRDSVFVFPDIGHGLAPGIFRAEGLRAVFVDWKSGGQVNYSKDFAEEWWFRWQQTIAGGFKPTDLPRYEAMGIRYVVLSPANRLPRPAAFENGEYIVYSLP